MRSFARWLARVALGYALGFCGLVLAVAASRATLRTPDPTLLLLDRQGAFLAELGPHDDADLGFWPLDALPPRVVAATLALEDRRFHEHPGVDPVALVRALRQNLEAGEVVSGASTLAMQVARMQDPGPRTLGRKAVEAVTAALLTARYGRDAILSHYLRLVPYGNRVHGVRYAARRYLDKPVEDLSWAETAFLAALPQAPGRTNPFDEAGRARAKARARRILDALRAEGWIDAAELELALHQLDAIGPPRPLRRPPAAMHWVLRMEQRLAGEPLDGPLLQGDPVVLSALDLPLQEQLTALLARRVASLRGRGVEQGAILVVDRVSGEVRAAVGSAGWGGEGLAGSIDYTRTPRLPGSTLKPFLYAAALGAGVIRPDTVLDDIGRGPEGIRNADHRSLGPMLPRQALGNSRNVPAVLLLQALGVDAAYAVFRDLGLHDDALPASHYGLALAIGGMPVTLEQLVTAATALADDGRAGRLVWVRGEPRRSAAVLEPGAARAVLRWLSDPLARLPSFPRMGFAELPFPVAMKTGTSGDVRDAWAFAITRRHIVGVWLGHPDARPMSGVTGYQGGARLARDVLALVEGEAMDGRSDHALPAPEGWSEHSLCALSGREATTACDRVVREWLPPGTAPEGPCPNHVLRSVDLRTGLLATAQVPPEHRRDRVFVQAEPRWASWAAEAGLLPPPDALSLPGEGRPVEGSPTAPRDQAAPALRVLSPREGLRLLRDPEVPAEAATLPLRLEASPGVTRVLWLVDGEPFALVEAPFDARWPLTPGRHTVQAQVPWTDWRSPTVAFEVR